MPSLLQGYMAQGTEAYGSLRAGTVRVYKQSTPSYALRVRTAGYTEPWVLRLWQVGSGSSLLLLNLQVLLHSN